MWNETQLLVALFGASLLEAILIGMYLLKDSDDAEETYRGDEDDWYDWYSDHTNDRRLR